MKKILLHRICFTQILIVLGLFIQTLSASGNFRANSLFTGDNENAAYPIKSSASTELNVLNSSIGLVTKIVNKVTLFRDQKPEDCKTGKTLVTGDKLETGDRSLAIVKFLDNSLLKVQEKSALIIYADKNNKELNKNTHIDKGTVGFKVTKQENEEFKFSTPTMVASIRGTEGFFDVNDNGSTFLAVANGTVEIEAKSGSRESGVVQGGYYVEVSEDGKIEVKENDENINKKLENVQKVSTKTIKIKTSAGDIIIEYLD